jgi:8-oxo-dGTP diphosphatase
MLRYTIIFLRAGSRLLLLNRDFPPLMGLWNGVGGKVEPGEEPLAAAQREVAEETGIQAVPLRYAGVVTWTVDGEPGGMWAFLGDLPPEAATAAPRLTDEGILAWKEIDWIRHPKNGGVASNLPRFLPAMLAGGAPAEYHCVYQEGRLVDFVIRPLRPEWRLLS